MSVSVTEYNILTAIRSFLLSILPSTVTVVRAQVNRVPEPANTDFVVMTPVLRERLATNVDTNADALFTGSISGAIMTLSAVSFGSISGSSTVFGTGVVAGTVVTGFLSGTGGVGTYSVTPSQFVPSQPIAAGTQSYQMSTKVTIQLDVHGPNSADNTQIISTLFHDDYADQYFQSTGVDVEPLYASDPKQMPFINAEQQYEERWTIDLLIETNPLIVLPQQFAGAFSVTLIEVDAAYHP